MTCYLPNHMSDLGKVAVFMGGWSSEREVSLISGRAVVEACQSLGIDVVAIDLQSRDHLKSLNLSGISRVFIALHGVDGEGGLVQAWLRVAGIPFTGSGMAASSLCMDKIAAKAVCSANGIPCLPQQVIHRALQSEAVNLPYPLCVKPNQEGSSFGVVRVDDPAHLQERLACAMKYDQQWLIEPWVEGREFTVAVLGGLALPVIEIKVSEGFYDYNNKYVSHNVQYEVPCSLSAEHHTQLQNWTQEIFKILGCLGWARADFIQDKQGQFWFLEMNTVPGLTRKSLVPQAAAAVGVEFEQLIAMILAETLPEDQRRTVRIESKFI